MSMNVGNNPNAVARIVPIKVSTMNPYVSNCILLLLNALAPMNSIAITNTKPPNIPAHVLPVIKLSNKISTFTFAHH